MGGRRERGGIGLPGMEAAKEAKETTAQKSSHQNMRFWRRRPTRATVTEPETTKNARAESAVRKGQPEERAMRNGTH